MERKVDTQILYNLSRFPLMQILFSLQGKTIISARLRLSRKSSIYCLLETEYTKNVECFSGRRISKWWRNNHLLLYFLTICWKESPFIGPQVALRTLCFSRAIKDLQHNCPQLNEFFSPMTKDAVLLFYFSQCPIINFAFLLVLSFSTSILFGKL